MAAGLTSAEARNRLAEFGENRIDSQRRTDAFALFIVQFKSPIILILIGAAIVSLFLQDRTDATLILAIVLASAVLGFWQEYSATNAVAKLRALVETKARVMRDGENTITECLYPLLFLFGHHFSPAFGSMVPSSQRRNIPSSSFFKLRLRN